jgi:hypothetical protein
MVQQELVGAMRDTAVEGIMWMSEHVYEFENSYE